MKNLDIKKFIKILENTPQTLKSMLSHLDAEMLEFREKKDAWNVIDVVNHLAYMDEKNWMKRVELIVNTQRHNIRTPTLKTLCHLTFQNLSESLNCLDCLLDEFVDIRKKNTDFLKGICLEGQNIAEWKALHPDFGEINLDELLSTWVAHDLTHTHQISRIIAKSFKGKVLLSLIQ